MELSSATAQPSTRSGGFWPSAPTRRLVHYLGAAPLVVLLGWFAFVRATRVPLLGWLDLAVHEFGHVATAWLPGAVNLAMGSGMQVLVPLGIAAGLWWRSRDPLGAGIALAWAGTSAQDASVYIADAPFQRLPLIGGVHDWATLLGPRHLDALGAADELAGLVWLTGLAGWAAGAGVLVWHAWRLHFAAPTAGEADDLPASWSLPGS